MDKKEFEKLLARHFDGQTTIEEAELIERFSAHFIKENEKTVFTSEGDKQRIARELRDRVLPKAESQDTGWLRIAASVAILLALSAALWFGVNQHYAHDMLMTSTTAGERVQVRLADETVVHLNGNSVLHYPKEFDEAERHVSIEGEGYFDVTHNPSKPFVVEAGDVKTTVLGTRFNVKSFAEDSVVSISLLQGSVIVNGFDHKDTIVPNEQAVFDVRSLAMNILPFDSLNIIGWRTNQLIFERTAFAEVIKVLNRQYGVQVELEDPAFSAYTISGKFDDADIKTVLASITAAKGLDYRMESDQRAIIYQP